MTDIYWQLFSQLLKSFFLPFFAVLLFFVFLRITPYIIKYSRSNYRKESGVGLLKFLFDKGSFGEGLIFFELEKIPQYGKIMTNLYLPTENGTTEIDVVYLAESGIYVLESKNYSGWIFGNARSKNWKSVIYRKKYSFYNPIWQNNKHVKYLKQVLGDVQTKSVIVFSQRCELKKLDVSDNLVIKRPQLRKLIEKDTPNKRYSEKEIEVLYTNLQTFSKQSTRVEQAHIQRIQK